MAHECRIMQIPVHIRMNRCYSSRRRRCYTYYRWHVPATDIDNHLSRHSYTYAVECVGLCIALSFVCVCCTSCRVWLWCSQIDYHFAKKWMKNVCRFSTLLLHSLKFQMCNIHENNIETIKDPTI